MNQTWIIKRTIAGDSLQKMGEGANVICVPETPGNRHYEEYLQWVAEGNEPEVVSED